MNPSALANYFNAASHVFITMHKDPFHAESVLLSFHTIELARVVTGAGRNQIRFSKQPKLRDSLPDIGDIIITKQVSRLSHVIRKSHIEDGSNY